MRLVIEYTVGDGYTYSATETVPIEYESAEAFAVEFEEACLVHKQNRVAFLSFANKEWQVDDFFEEGVYYAPNLFTVDEWFACHANQYVR